MEEKMQTSLQCPTTGATVTLNLKDDRQTIFHDWDRPVEVRCPHCGKVHLSRYRDMYVEGVLSNLHDDFDRIFVDRKRGEATGPNV
jgi:hypothetical protein